MQASKQSVYEYVSTKVDLKPPTIFVGWASCNLKIDSMTDNSVAVVSRPAKATQLQVSVVLLRKITRSHKDQIRWHRFLGLLNHMPRVLVAKMIVLLDLVSSFVDVPAYQRNVSSKLRYQSPLITKCTITSNKGIPSYCLSKYFYTEYITNNLLRLSFDIRMHKSDIVITCDNISQRRQSFFNSLYFDTARNRISKM